jgi:hypothetical protein
MFGTQGGIVRKHASIPERPAVKHATLAPLSEGASDSAVRFQMTNFSYQSVKVEQSAVLSALNR